MTTPHNLASAGALALAVAIDEPAAESAGIGKCGQCLQTRPLFKHEQTRRWTEEHDCPDCYGHDETEKSTDRLCPRCWAQRPTEVDE